MKRNFIGLILTSILIVGGAAGQSTSQPACKVNVQAPAFGLWTWAAHTHVNVYILESNFKAEEIHYVLLALQQWDAASELTGSGVTLNYEGITLAPVRCDNCLTIMRAPVFNKKTHHAAELMAYKVEGDQATKFAEIRLDSSITNPASLTHLLSHELGHGFGLVDCYSCKDRSTVMNQGFNGPEGPTGCDIVQVREAYKDLNARMRTAPVKQKVLADEGEEPEDDDTPIVIPNPSIR
jgi:hypothetical protein